jgi:hypothetical protein
MVRRANLILALALVAAAAAAPARAELAIQFKMEFSKPEVYVGEHVLCNFVLYSTDDILEAEVAKFPEFRGFWSENLILRQGPISLAPDIGALKHPDAFGASWKKAIIGTYLLTSMLGKNDSSVEPLKLVVRRLGTSGIDIAVDSSGPPLKLKPLPPVPAAMQGEFHGAVGTFNFFVESNVVAFQKDEPITLRMLLQGEGNFPEINELPIAFPKEVEVLSRKSFVQGTGQFSTKTFEVTVAVHSDKPVLIPPIVFAYFNPVTERYETAQSQAISLQWQAPAPIAQPLVEPLDLGPPDLTWSSAEPPLRSPCFWLAQAVCLGTILLVVARRIRRKFRRRQVKTPAFQRQLKLQSALAHWQHGDLENFLRLADELAFELLSRLSPPQADPLTRSRLLILCGGRLDAASLAHARALFQAYERFAFSPQKTAPPDPRALLESLNALAGNTSF